MEKEAIKLPKFAYDMIYYIEIPKETTKKKTLLEIINEFSKIASTRSTDKYKFYTYILTKSM